MLVAILPEKFRRIERKTITFEYQDKDGKFRLRDVTFNPDEFSALRDAFYKKFREEQRNGNTGK